ncbi:MAG TPA: hypothetical protein VK922_18665 [Gemmatimonadaceae bacterium]|nr:hypothetical protein [Gemmatimonadaceae bacterium]
MRTPTILTGLLLLALAPPACAQQQRPSTSSPAPVARPLAAMAEQPVILLPTLYLRPADSLGWAAQIPTEREWLATVDDEIAFALRERGAARRWTLPDDLRRAARRNAAFAPDPSTVAAQPLRPRGRQLPQRVPEPLISQLRSLIALRDEVRFALLPVEVRFEPLADGGGRALLHLVLVDVRRAEFAWAIDVPSEPAAELSPALAASLGSRVADLIAAP